MVNFVLPIILTLPHSILSPTLAKLTILRGRIYEFFNSWARGKDVFLLETSPEHWEVSEILVGELELEEQANPSIKDIRSFEAYPPERMVWISSRKDLNVLLFDHNVNYVVKVH